MLRDLGSRSRVWTLLDKSPHPHVSCRLVAHEYPILLRSSDLRKLIPTKCVVNVEFLIDEMLPHHNSLVPVEVRHVEEDSIRHLLACEGLVSGE